MTRPLPIGLLFFAILLFYMKFGAALTWIISGIAFIALLAVIFLMYRRDMYVGPKTLVDDVRRVRDKVMRDQGGEADRVQNEALAMRQEMLDEDEAQNQIEIARASSRQRDDRSAL